MYMVIVLRAATCTYPTWCRQRVRTLHVCRRAGAMAGMIPAGEGGAPSPAVAARQERGRSTGLRVLYITYTYVRVRARG